MPGRKTVLATGQIYHLFNRGNSFQPTFLNAFDYRRFIKTINFYRFAPHSAKLFQFLEFSGKRRKEYFDDLARKAKELVSVFSFCLMPNHYHLLVKQEEENGISKFMSQLQNSYTKYYFHLQGGLLLAPWEDA